MSTTFEERIQTENTISASLLANACWWEPLRLAASAITA